MIDQEKQSLGHQAAPHSLGAQARSIVQEPIGLEGRARSVPVGNYVQPVPDHCDRIVWRNRYYHLPEGLSQKPVAWACTDYDGRVGGQAEPTDAERHAFEAWASDQGFPLPRLDIGDGESYADLRTQSVWDAWQASSALAASSAAPTADLRAAILNLPVSACRACKGTGSVTVWVRDMTDGSGQGDYTEVRECPECAAAQLAAVAAPPLGQCETCKAPAHLGRCTDNGRTAWAAVAAPEARIEKQEMGNQAAPGSLDASRAPLSEPCALDQGARPVRLSPERIKELLEQEYIVTGDEQFRNGRHFYRSLGHPANVCEHDLFNFARAVARECGIAPPVAQPGSTK